MDIRFTTKKMGYKYEKRMVPVISGFECDACGQEFDSEAMMGTPADTPESAELEELVTAVELYEDEHYPIESPTETQALRKLINASEHSAQDGTLTLDEAFEDRESPFDNMILTSALDPATQRGYWLGHVGQGVEDALPMRPEQLREFQRRIEAGELEPSGERYVYAVKQRLTLYKRSPYVSGIPR